MNLQRREIARMAQAARTDRDSILIKFLYETGCAPAEATKVKVKHVNIANATVYIEAHGRKPARLSYISTSLAREIAAYTRQDEQDSYLFSVTKKEPLTPKRISQIVAELGKVIEKKITPIDIRYAHIRQALEYGIPLIEVQRQVGLESTRAAELYNTLAKDL